MRKIFWEDPYLQTLQTTVRQVDGKQIVLNETIGYSESGGQESDQVTINGLNVLSSRMDRSQPFLIYYELPDNHELVAGSAVKMHINWIRRYRLMRYHFACELVLVLMNRLFNGTPEGVELKPEEVDTLIVKRGAHMSEDGARVDFAHEGNIAEYFPRIMEGFNQIVAADIPIETGYLDEPNQVRYWRLPHFATIPCGGTHVRSTGEVGQVSLKRDRANKGVERIRIKLD